MLNSKTLVFLVNTNVRFFWDTLVLLRGKTYPTYMFFGQISNFQLDMTSLWEISNFGMPMDLSI
jgi:hypothetical protein